MISIWETLIFKDLTTVIQKENKQIKSFEYYLPSPPGVGLV